MKSWKRKSIIAIVMVGLIATAFAGVALAAESDAGGFGPKGHKGHFPLGQLAEETGLTREEIVEELQAGKTPAEILTENGGDPDTFVAGVLADLEAKLDEAVANERIDQAQADEILANAEVRLNEAMDSTFDPSNFGGRGRHAGRNIFGRLSEATGLTPEELRAEFEAGKTPAEILAENGGDVDAFLAELLADLEARLDEAVADERIDQARADEILADAETRLEEALNSPHTPRERGEGFGGGGRGPGFGLGGPQGGPPVSEQSL